MMGGTSPWPWIVSLLIGLPVLYVATFGSACWLAYWLDKEPDWQESLLVAYRPLLFSVARCPTQVQDALIHYGDPCGNLQTAFDLVNLSVYEARRSRAADGVQ